MVSNKSLLVLDFDCSYPSWNGDVLVWQNHDIDSTSNHYSVIQLVENDHDYYKSKYLSLIYELGETVLNGKSIVEHLEIRKGFSFWWMTLLSEKCNYAKSPDIEDIIKLMAFKRFIISKGYTEIILISSNKRLHESIQMLAVKLEINFRWDKADEEKVNINLANKVYNKLPYALQGILWIIRQVIFRWPLKGVGVEKWISSSAKSTFVSYLSNFDQDAAKKGEFKSNYWADLPEILEKEKVCSNWIHLSIDNKISSLLSKNIIDCFNNSSGSHNNHVSIYSFLSLRIIFRVILDWIYILKKSFYIQKYIKNKSNHYWSFVKHDFKVSTTGSVALSNLLYLALFEKAMSSIAIQKNGVYLQENQGWEFGLIYSWKAAGHKNSLLGFPHSTIRYWDLRYFFDYRNYKKKCLFKLPLPDFIGVHGSKAKGEYLSQGFPSNRIVKVEALRYLYLSQTQDYIPPSVGSNTHKIKVLIIGDYLRKNTIRQMDLLNGAALLTDNAEYLLKPHPACNISYEDYSDISIKITDAPIPLLLEKFSVAFVSSTTSASIDIYCSGKPVIVAMGSGLNMSPLRGYRGVKFVNSAKELSNALIDLNMLERAKNKHSCGNYFYLDNNLPKWKGFFI